MRTAQKGRKLNDLSKNIKCGNSLIDDPAVAGDKAFNWQQEFKYIFENGGFDVVIGNPPYVTGNTLDSSNELIRKKFVTAQYQLDLYILFIEKGVTLIKNAGFLSFITQLKYFRLSQTCLTFLRMSLLIH